ncbi:hypothetical protein FOZ60_009200 [Perkinsus olseni]|uniref:MRH domain-containing protein n=1 Tax=Perkinsus olseni TaxID=32597 RepID=A0A7J6PEA1_PEROL|nr:hypothetical protein FOZ60_009200 [Perkinsus olseni]
MYTLGNGSICHENNETRSVLVKLACPEDWEDWKAGKDPRVESLVEVALCRYTLSISVPALCADLRMLPRKRNSAEDEISCFRVESSSPNQERHDGVAIFTDGSVVKDVKTGTAMAVRNILSSRASAARWDRQIYLSLSESPGRISLRWVPGHSYISADGRADELVAKGASMREVSAETKVSTRASCQEGQPGWPSLGTSVNDSPECDQLARKRVKGGVPGTLSPTIYTN